MAPTTFHLVQVRDQTAFFTALRRLPPDQKPLYIGHCHHWVHYPDHLSFASLVGTKWDFLLCNVAADSTSMALPEELQPSVRQSWSITADTPDDLLATYSRHRAERAARPPPSLPAGWSKRDPSGLDAAVAPSNLETSLAMSSPSQDDPDSTPGVPLKTFIRQFPDAGPVNMFNLVSCLPGQRARYFEYMAFFGSSLGPRYGTEAQLLGLGATAWSSRHDDDDDDTSLKHAADTVDQHTGWQDVGLIWYPSIWHFAKLLDDPDYAEADRRYKQGVLRSNPILCCTEVQADLYVM